MPRLERQVPACFALKGTGRGTTTFRSVLRFWHLLKAAIRSAEEVKRVLQLTLQRSIHPTQPDAAQLTLIVSHRLQTRRSLRIITNKNFLPLLAKEHLPVPPLPLSELVGLLAQPIERHNLFPHK